MSRAPWWEQGSEPAVKPFYEIDIHTQVPRHWPEPPPPPPPEPYSQPPEPPPHVDPFAPDPSRRGK